VIEDGAPLAGRDALLADLDGVVYAAAEAIPHAVDALRRAVREGIRVGYVTNNASRTDAQVATQLRGLGLDAAPEDVITSPQAALELLREAIAPGGTVLVVGGEGITELVERAGYRVTRSADDEPDAVVQGFHPSVGWADLAEASFAIERRGIPWIATNQDWTFPHSRGVAPGNGTLVAAVHTATGTLPVVAGKPERAIFDTAVHRLGASAPLMIGDRLDTDVAGARRAGIPSALVLTGIDGARQLLPAAADERPDFILGDLRELFEPYPAASAEAVASGDGDRGAIVRVRHAAVRLDGSRVSIETAGTRPVDLVRAVTTLVWGIGTPIYALDIAPELVSLRP